MAVRKKITYTVSSSKKSPAGLKSGSSFPDGDADALIRSAETLYRKNRFAESVAACDRAIALNPENAEFHHQRAIALRALNRLDEAISAYDRAITINPNNAQVHGNRGVALCNLDRFDEAIADYDRAIAINPDYPKAHCNRGIALCNLNRYREAIADYDRAIMIRPDYPDAQWGRCLALLTTGDFSEAWEQYGWRWKNNEITLKDTNQTPFWYGTAQRRGKHDLPHGVPCAFDLPFWDGSPNRDSLLLWPEQGIGEQVLFCSMLHEARARVGQLTLILQRKLHPLFQRAFPDCHFITSETAVAENHFDWQIPLGELGRLLRPSVDDFLRQRSAYLKADSVRTAELRNAIAPKQQRIVGLSWYSRNSEYGTNKTLSLDLLAPLLAMPGVRFVDLQYGDTSQERDDILRRTGVEISRIASVDNWKDIDGFAALVNACDLVISISNTTAHIAGAMGKDVLLMLPHSKGRFWYWQAERDDSLFYPGMQIFRQHAIGDWSPVIDRVCAAATATLNLKSGKA